MVLGVKLKRSVSSLMFVKVSAELLSSSEVSCNDTEIVNTLLKQDELSTLNRLPNLIRIA